MLPEPEAMSVAVRAYTEPPAPVRPPRAGKEPTPLPPSDWALAFDTETCTHAAQQLRVGAYQLRWAGDASAPLPVPCRMKHPRIGLAGGDRTASIAPLAGDRRNVRLRCSAAADRFGCTLADGRRGLAPVQWRSASPPKEESMRRRAVFARALALGAARAATLSDANKTLIHRIVAGAFNAGDAEFIGEALGRCGAGFVPQAVDGLQVVLHRGRDRRGVRRVRHLCAVT